MTGLNVRVGKVWHIFSTIECRYDARQVIGDSTFFYYYYSGFSAFSFLKPLIHHSAPAALVAPLAWCAAFGAGGFILCRNQSRTIAAILLLMCLFKVVALFYGAPKKDIAPGMTFLLLMLWGSIRTVEAAFKLQGRFKNSPPAGPLIGVLKGRYFFMKMAMAARDSKAMTAFLAPTFESVDISGRVSNAAQLLEAINARKDDANKSSDTTLISVKVEGSNVIVEQAYQMETLQAVPEGRRPKVKLVTLSTDTWIRPAKVWLLHKTVTNEVSCFKDGALISHQVKGP